MKTLFTNGFIQNFFAESITIWRHNLFLGKVPQVQRTLTITLHTYIKSNIWESEALHKYNENLQNHSKRVV